MDTERPSSDSSTDQNVILAQWYCHHLPTRLLVIDVRALRVVAADASSLALALPTGGAIPALVSEVLEDSAINLIQSNQSGSVSKAPWKATADSSVTNSEWWYDSLIPGELGVFYLVTEAAISTPSKSKPDPHTGLLTRGELWPVLESSLTRYRNYGIGFAVIFLDVDYFKPINDQLGHLAGDEVLRCVAAGILNAIRPGDEAIRYGGDEIVLVIGGLNSQAEAAAVGRRLAQSIPQTAEYQGKPITFTVSMGVAFSRPDDATPQAILERADLAMYRAKNRGRRGEIEVD